MGRAKAIATRCHNQWGCIGIICCGYFKNGIIIIEKDDHPFHEPRRVNYYYGIIDDQDLAAILCILLVVAQTV
jgi:hypothetical protein